MIKRVKLDKNGWPTEIDWNATRRVTLDLMAYIESAPLDENIYYQYKERVAPLIEATLNGSLKIPFFGQKPYDFRSITEGWYPQLIPEFETKYSAFMCRIRPDIGVMSLSYHESGHYDFEKYREIDKEGNVYELCWFEE